MLVIRYTKKLQFFNLEQFKEYHIENVIPFLDLIPNGSSNYQHLEFAGCGSISAYTLHIEQHYKKHYPGLFIKGFTQSEFDNISGKAEVQNSLLIPALHDNDLLQIAALDDENLERMCTSAGMNSGVCNQIRSLQNSKSLSHDEIKNYLVSLDPRIKKLIELWENTQIKNLTLTSVGIALANANLRRNLGLQLNLSTWIN